MERGSSLAIPVVISNVGLFQYKMEVQIMLKWRSLILMVLIVALIGVIVPAQAEKVTLTFWGMGNGVEAEKVQRQIIDEWNASHPNIQVKYEVIPWQEYYEKFLTAVRSHSAPDVSEGSSYQPLLFAPMGELLPVDDIIKKWEKSGRLKDMVSENYRNYFWNSHYWALPNQVDPRVIFYRKDVFEKAGIKPPTTWEEFRAAAKALTRDTNGDGRIDFYGFATGLNKGFGGDHTMANFMIQAGASTFDKDGKLVFNSPATVRTLEFLRDLIVVDKVVPPGAASMNLEDAETVFLNGDAAMVFTTTWFLFRLDSEGAKIKDKVAVLPILEGPGGPGNRYMLGWTNPVMVYKQTKHPKEAMQLLEYLTEPKNLSRLYETGLFMWPAERKFFKLNFYNSDQLHKDITNLVVPRVKDYTYPCRTALPIINVIEGESIWAQTLQKVVVEGMTPEAAAAWGEKEIKRLMKSF